MPNKEAPLLPSELERLVLDAEVATDAILETPKLQPASLGNLVGLAETIADELDARVRQGDTVQAHALRDLQKRMFAILRRLSGSG